MKRLVTVLFAVAALIALLGAAPPVAAADEAAAVPTVQSADVPAPPAGSEETPAATRDAAPTAISLVAEQQAIGLGKRAVLRGVLFARGVALPPGLTVTISAQAAGEAGFTILGTVPVAANGSFAIAHSPQHSTTYRADFAGDATLAPATSPDVPVQVRSAVKFTAPAIAWFGEQATFGGSIAPARAAGTPVLVQYFSGGIWQTLVTATLDDQSRFSVSWTATSAARLKLRALAQADASNAAGASARRFMTARDPDPHGVPVTLTKCVVIDHSEFRVYYYEQGHIVRDFPCVLGKRSTPTPYGRFRVYRKVPHPGGPNGAYYLKYHGIIGIHGTNAPQLLRHFPRAYSHGCARLYNRDITWLYRRVPIGTPVWNVR